jgi:hypothetical protein
MATKPSPSPAFDAAAAPTLGASLPTDAAGTTAPLRCIQRPTGEWFTFATGNPPGRDTPDASDLLTEAEARARLAEHGLVQDAADAAITGARERAEVSGDIVDWNVAPGGGV